MINVLILDFNTSSGPNEQPYFEATGRHLCYCKLLIKETIKLVSLFDEDTFASELSAVKPHIIICPHKGSSTFRFFNAAAYNAASLLATLMEFDSAGPIIQSSTKNQTDCTLSVLDYIAQGFVLGREVASSRKIANSKLVLFLFSVENFVTQSTPNITSISKYASELAKTKSGQTYISNKYIDSIEVAIYCCLASEKDADSLSNSFPASAVVDPSMSFDRDHIADRLNHLKSIMTNNVTQNFHVSISSLLATSIYFEESFRDLRSEIFHSQTSIIVFSKNISGLKCNINVQLYPMSLNSLRLQGDLTQLEIVCLLPSNKLPCSFIEGNAFIVQAPESFSQDASGVKSKSETSRKQNDTTFQCFCQSLSETSTMAIVSTQAADKSTREVWALVPPQLNVSTAPVTTSSNSNSSGSNTSSSSSSSGGNSNIISSSSNGNSSSNGDSITVNTSGEEDIAGSDNKDDSSKESHSKDGNSKNNSYNIYNKLTLIRLVNRDSLLNPKVLSKSADVLDAIQDKTPGAGSGAGKPSEEETELVAFFKEIFTSAIVPAFNPLIFVSGSLNVKLLKLIDAQANNSSSNSNNYGSSNGNANSSKNSLTSNLQSQMSKSTSYKGSNNSNSNSASAIDRPKEKKDNYNPNNAQKGSNQPPNILPQKRGGGPKNDLVIARNSASIMPLISSETTQPVAQKKQRKFGGAVNSSKPPALATATSWTSNGPGNGPAKKKTTAAAFEEVDPGFWS